jgi:hypothetical protein
LSLIGEEDVADDSIEAALDSILQSSLWQRRLLRTDAGLRNALRTILLTRSRFIWARSTPAARRGYFLAGLGLEAGHALDAVAPAANQLLVQANAALLVSDAEAAIEAITSLAESLFGFYPFMPDPFPENWKAILRSWLLGRSLAGTIAGQEGDGLRFIEGGLVYRLPWAMEALRVRATANGDIVGQFGMTLDDYELGLAVPAVETGTMNRSASILIQAGFNSRLAAIKVVNDTGAVFTTQRELREWLQSPMVADLSAQPDWPTTETKPMWLDFAEQFVPRDDRTWAERNYRANAQWYGVPAPPGAPLYLHHWNGQPLILSADGGLLGVLQHPLSPNSRGLVRGTASMQPGIIDISYLGPNDLWVG